MQVMGRRYAKLSVDAAGWCEWQRPIHGHGDQNYRMACCDCGLVHDMQFRVKRNGERLYVVFRAKRNNRATAGIRRGKK